MRDGLANSDSPLNVSFAQPQPRRSRQTQFGIEDNAAMLGGGS